MSISDEEKRKIMQDLARGNPDLPVQKPNPNFVLNDQNDAKDYQKFDDFAQPSHQGELGKLLNQPSAETDARMYNQLKERINSDINQAKEIGQLRSDRIREIVESAVFQVASEFKYGTSDVRLIVKDAVSTVVDNLQQKSGEVKEEISASIEGAIEGITNWRRKSIAKFQEEVNRLQARIDIEENELQQEIDGLLTDIEQDKKVNSPLTKDSIASAINALKNSEEVALMQRQYAQLQGQLAILRANLAARYGGRHEEIKEHLDQATTWYNKTRTQVEPVVEQALQKREQLEEKLGDAGAAVAKKERGIRQVLSDLLILAAEVVRDKEPPANKKSV